MKIMKCLYCLYCPKFGQLIIRKIIRIVALCQIFGGKNVRNSIFGSPDPTWEAYSAPLLVELTVLPWPLAAFKGQYF